VYDNTHTATGQDHYLQSNALSETPSQNHYQELCYKGAGANSNRKAAKTEKEEEKEKD
jgi:hypothetical protein